jgi:hypothetical protein
MTVLPILPCLLQIVGSGRSRRQGRSDMPQGVGDMVEVDSRKEFDRVVATLNSGEVDGDGQIVYVLKVNAVVCL